MTDQRETTDQLDLFRQPPEPKSAGDAGGKPASPAEPPLRALPRAKQLTELPGETFEDIFGDAA